MARKVSIKEEEERFARTQGWMAVILGLFAFLIFLAIVAAVLSRPAHGAGTTPSGESHEARLQRIASRLTTANSIHGVEFRVEDKKELNAMAGNGRIVVYSGLMSAMTDNEVAWVLSHELSHLRGRHDRKAGAATAAWNILGRVAEESRGRKAGLIVGIIGLLDFSSRSRRMEKQADAAANEICRRGGFDPAAGITALEKIKRRYGRGLGGVPLLKNVASHPDTRSRIDRVRAATSPAPTATATEPVPPDGLVAEPANTPGVFAGSTATAASPVRVAVVRLEVTGDYYGGIREWLPDYITSRIAEAGWQAVEVLERRNIDDVLREQDFWRSGRVDGATAPAADKLRAATHLVQLTARVSTEDVVAGLGGSWGGWNLEGGRVAKATVALNGRIVGTATGAVVAVGITGKSKSRLTGATVILPRRRSGGWGGVGGHYRISDRRERLVFSAAEAAADQLIKMLAPG